MLYFFFNVVYTFVRFDNFVFKLLINKNYSNVLVEPLVQSGVIE